MTSVVKRGYFKQAMAGLMALWMALVTAPASAVVCTDGPLTDEQLMQCACTDGQMIECGPTNAGVGECRYGQATCGGGRWGSCFGAVWPEPEICGNGLDEDCNGIADDGCKKGSGKPNKGKR